MDHTEKQPKNRIRIDDVIHKPFLRMKPIVAAAMKLCCPELKGETLLAIEKRISPSPLIPALDPTVGSRAAGENCEVCDDGTKTVFDSLFIREFR